MTNKGENSLDSLNQLFAVIANNRKVPTKLTDDIRVLNTLVDDMGHRMADDMRLKWIDRMAEIVSDCDKNIYGLTKNTQHLYVGALRGLEGRFNEIVEEDHIAAGKYYEDAARTIDLIPEKLSTDDLLGPLPQESGTAGLDASMCVGVDLMILRLPVIDLWDRAGDAYYRGVKMENAKRCYEAGIETVRVSYPKPKEPARADLARLRGLDLYFCHLLLSLASVVIVSNDEWDKAEALYREAADTIFFNKEEKTNDQYYDLCGVLALVGATGFLFSRRKGYIPHVRASLHATGQQENLLKLATEIGQKALDELIREYDIKKSFPVPEIFYLVGILSYFYSDLGQYEKCANFVPLNTNFGRDYWDWTWAELEELADTAFEWVHPHVAYCREMRFAEGLIQRPDYKEFVENIKKMEESHERQELRLIRQERMLRDMDKRPSSQEIQAKLLCEHPWLGNIANQGSLINAEDLYQRLGKQNWAEVIMGYCNAVEEELKQYVYKKYLGFRAGFNKAYAEESEKQSKEGAVLSFIAAITRNSPGRRIWEKFVTVRIPEHREFLLKELPLLLSQLVPIRNKAAHGEMLEKKFADQARRIVMGRSSEAGLLEKLSKIRVE